MPSISLYVRRKGDRYHKCSPKAVYVLGTTFVLRYEADGRRRWEKLASGIDYTTAKRTALEKELALYRGESAEKQQERRNGSGKFRLEISDLSDLPVLKPIEAGNRSV